MRTQSSAIASTGIAVSGRSRTSAGTLQAALGVVAFSLTFPATAWGLEGFGPWSLVAVRSVLAALIAGGCLLALRVPVPGRAHWPGLAVVAAGVVIGFPLLTTLALQTSTTGHAAVVVGLLPLTTALCGAGEAALRVGARSSAGRATIGRRSAAGRSWLATPPSSRLRSNPAGPPLRRNRVRHSPAPLRDAGEPQPTSPDPLSPPSRTFWTAALAGSAAVVAFTVQQSGGALTTADLYLFGALLVCAAGYTAGGRLARVMPGWQVVGWALVLCLPIGVPAAAFALSQEPVRLTAHSVTGLLWVAAGSQFLGLVVWYRGMAAIGIPKASQLQLAQPLLTLVWSVLLLGEHLTVAAPLTAAAVLVCIAVTQRARG